jgi:hypothetical protein
MRPVADGVFTGSISASYAPTSPGIVVSGGTHTSGFELDGGQYSFEVTGTISSGGSVQLTKVQADGSATLNVGSAVSSGATPNYQTVNVPFGGFRVSVTSATVTVGMARIPTD